MNAGTRWKSGVSFEATSGSGHTIVTDGPPDAGGENAGPRPMGRGLTGVDACSAYDAVHILR
jgi:putative redox protein